MKRLTVAILAMIGLMTVSLAHTPGVNLTWNREISRVFYARCANCHRQGGTSFSLMTYPEVQPHLTEIKEQVLGRKMPPWGAVKGFGEFRNDQGLTQEEIELIGDWIDDADARKGNNPAMLPPVPKFSNPPRYSAPKGSIEVTGELKLDRSFVLDGLLPEASADAPTMKITAEFPNGHIEPLLWLYEYKDSNAHPFLFRKPIELPAGTVIRGVAWGAEVLLLPGKKAR